MYSELEGTTERTSEELDYDYVR